MRRKSWPQEQARQRIARTKPNCHICGKAIDYQLKWPHPMCFVVDHVQAIARGGTDTIDNKMAAHNACNSQKRARDHAPIIRRSGALD